MQTPLVAELITAANTFGANPEYSRAGGGNASLKLDGVLHIKPSGVPLATLTAEDLVPLRIDVLLDALHSEAAVVGDPVQAAATAARVGPSDGRRPSVEILFHALLPEPLVLHTHPLIANAVTCNVNAAALTAELLGDEAVFVPYTDPGVPLARAVERERAAYVARTGNPAPRITLLGNHGIIVAGHTAAEIAERSQRIEAAVNAALAASPTPGTPPAETRQVAQVIATLAPVLAAALGSPSAPTVVVADASEFVRQTTSSAAGAALADGGPLIPDQIVYAGSFPLVVPLDDLGSAPERLAAFRAARGRDPIVAVVPGVVVFGSGADENAAKTALGTYLDALAVARDAELLGGVRTMTSDEREFIENWEAEAYRKAVAAKG
ncbi:MAG TPA: aldolase [Propionibacteriaceae bacterium]|nr:class II aldolase [Micropruina sp.]HBY22060.1 aldolase [Propionibacteriaceae bacterium]